LVKQIQEVVVVVEVQQQVLMELQQVEQVVEVEVVDKVVVQLQMVVEQVVIQMFNQRLELETQVEEVVDLVRELLLTQVVLV
tara:strand:- start:31 stop:276 length:246 start_codon:yes stop_codon:yes gene_type:complete